MKLNVRSNDPDKCKTLIYDLDGTLSTKITCTTSVCRGAKQGGGVGGSQPPPPPKFWMGG